MPSPSPFHWKGGLKGEASYRFLAVLDGAEVAVARKPPS
ncbi:hypothetical protein ABH935_007680 [Catenulispora sp. GAS73]